MKNSIDNSMNVIDSRDIIDRLEELESDYSIHIEEGGKDEEFDDMDELVSLRKLLDEWSDNSEWQYGAFFVRDSYWTDYCEELVKDIGDIPDNLPGYIENNIDWDGVAEDLQADYSDYDFDGVTYWCRDC